MTTFVSTNAHVTINGVDLSDRVRSVSFTHEVEAQDDTAMGDTTRSMAGGLKNWSMEVEFNQDYAASKVDVTLDAALGTVVTVAYRPVNTTIGATNPEYTGSGLIQSYGLAGGGVGDQAAATLSVVAAGTLTRSTS